MSLTKLILIFAKRYPIWILSSIVLGFSGAVFNGVSIALIVPALLIFLGQEVTFKDAAPMLEKLMFIFNNNTGGNNIVILTSLILGLIILKNITNYTATIVASSLKRKITTDLRSEGLKLLLKVDLDFFAHHRVGDIINRLSGEVGRTASAINIVIQMIIIAITVLVFVGLLLAISWQLTVASTVLLTVVALINQYAIARSKYFGKRLTEMSKAYSITVLETLSGIRLVKATANENREYEKIKKLIRDREEADFQSQLNSASIAPISEVTGIFSLLAIVFLGRLFFGDQIESLSTVLLTYLLVLFRLLPVISQLNSARSSFANASASIEVVNDFLRIENKPIMKSGTIPYKFLQKDIQFHQVSFAYPNNQDLVLKEVNLSLPRGTTLALVGASGAGKSTLADLLPRFYDPISGNITIDGIELKDFDFKTLRKGMGIVSQDTFLFNDSVRNNIAYPRPDATEEEIITAAKKANAYEFIVNLPHGLETPIGDRGVLLSGGQRQRLAIARALLQDPDILILDEATSALDSVSERLVQAAIEEVSRDRTTLVIAHRLSTVQTAHQIAVLDKGCVVEVGTHEELLNQGGHYTKLYQLQFADQHQSILNRNEQLWSRFSYEVRTRLNPVIGFLQLLSDDLVDSQTEQIELTEEAYNSALRLIESLDLLEKNSKSN